MTTAGQHTDFSDPRPADAPAHEGHPDEGHPDAGHRGSPAEGTGTESAATVAHQDTGADHGTGASRDTNGDATATGRRPDEPVRDPAAAAPGGQSSGTDAEGRERLVPQQRAQEYSSRWDAVKGTFVDEPRQAVGEADRLVGELLDELQELFSKQRKGLEHGLDSDETSTEDLRLALRRYRSFFDRLLSF